MGNKGVRLERDLLAAEAAQAERHLSESEPAGTETPGRGKTKRSGVSRGVPSGRGGRGQTRRGRSRRADGEARAKDWPRRSDGDFANRWLKDRFAEAANHRFYRARVWRPSGCRRSRTHERSLTVGPVAFAARCPQPRLPRRLARTRRVQMSPERSRRGKRRRGHPPHALQVARRCRPLCRC